MRRTNRCSLFLPTELKESGNRCYKKRDYKAAIKFYMNALEKAPFNVAVLTNVAQCYLRLEALDDSVEFSTRALFINPNHVKALSRRAAVWHRQQKWKEAAGDMEKALAIDPDNEDVVEQHSIIVGDYEDSLMHSKLETELAAKPSSGASKGAEELIFMMEVLRKMDEHHHRTPVSESDNGAVTGEEVESSSRCQHTDAWVAYELLLPCLERNANARALLRTSGELQKLTQRLCAAMTPSSCFFRSADDNETSSDQPQEPSTELLAINAMLHCLAASMISAPRNQVVLFRDVPFRRAFLAIVDSGLHEAGLRTLAFSAIAVSTQEAVMRVCEEAVDFKSWKKAMIASPKFLLTLIHVLGSEVDRNRSARNVHLTIRVALSISSVIFTISGDEMGLKALASMAPTALRAMASALTQHRREPSLLSNLLGLLTNLSTNAGVRATLESDDQDVGKIRSVLVKALLTIATQFTKKSVAATHRSALRVCAERALAALLNFSFQSESLVRLELLHHNVVSVVHRVLSGSTNSDAEPSTQPSSSSAWQDHLLVMSRSISLLCRLHTVPGISVDRQQELCHELSAPMILDQLYQVCQLTLSAVPSCGAVPGARRDARLASTTTRVAGELLDDSARASQTASCWATRRVSTPSFVGRLRRHGDCELARVAEQPCERRAVETAP
ncbi:hypothetical protein PINS_up007680 [Pythium insidiosum]|nr:hypothetical protein PINS_up007680 [Pythium insidiosum]